MRDINKRLEELERGAKRMRRFCAGIVALAILCTTFAATSGDKHGEGEAFHPWGVRVYQQFVAEYCSLFEVISDDIEMSAYDFELTSTNNVILNGNYMEIGSAGTMILSSDGGLNLSSNQALQMWSVGDTTIHPYGGSLVIDNGTTTINIADLAAQVDALQTQIDECCAATATCSGDIDENGEVAVADLLLLIAGWGTCP